MQNKPKRYFKYNNDPETKEIDIFEITKTEFDSIDGDFDVDEHTVFQNGVSQTCYTKHNGFVA